MSKPAPEPIDALRGGRDAALLLPADHLEWVDAWGMASRSMAWVFRPSTIQGVRDVLALARETGRTVVHRGGGCSYGDAFQNREEIVLDLSRMTRVLEWNPRTGLIALEPGVRIADLWRYVIGDGWWPPVVSGTMFTTMGGCCGMNIHGKNAWKVGPFGRHVREFDLLAADGSLRTVRPDSHPELFHSAISGFGMLGVITRVVLQLKKVHSGEIEVIPRRTRNIREMLDAFEDHADEMDYMVGWIDGFPTGDHKIGRGEMHFARQLAPGADAQPARTLRHDYQELPDTLLGVFPKSAMWRLMKPFVNKTGMRLINRAKYYAQFRPGGEKPYRQSHAAFHFLLDYVPNWRNTYRPGGMIQYQTFVPRAHAAEVFEEQLRLSHRAGIIPFLGVTKKHLPDDFLISHGVDGYSLALDYPVTNGNRDRLWRLCHDMDDLALEAGGRLYLAKDATMRPGTLERYLPEESLARFHRLKASQDPDGLFSSNMYRRLFGLEGRPAATRAGVTDGLAVGVSA